MKARSTVEIPLNGDFSIKQILHAFNEIGQDADGLRKDAAMYSVQNNVDSATLNYIGEMNEEQAKLVEDPVQWFEEHPDEVLEL